MTSGPGIAVIIAARDAAATIGDAVASALAHEQVTEVVLVDDASPDATATEASLAANGDGRLRIVRMERNVGPAAARNRAIEVSTAPVLALLDGDDRFLPNRLASLVARDDWDLIADNVVFVADPDTTLPPAVLAGAASRFETLTLADFVLGNVSTPGRKRGEYGFLKPLVSRAFLLRHGLRYDPALRLGEDYDLYVRALMAGGRFLLTRRPGYLAVIRPDSLSARHRTGDLAALAAVMREHLAHPSLDQADRAAMRRLLRQAEGRHAHRAVLDLKDSRGVPVALWAMLTRRGWALPVATGILRDKAFPARTPLLPAEGYRLLLPTT